MTELSKLTEFVCGGKGRWKNRINMFSGTKQFRFQHAERLCFQLTGTGGWRSPAGSQMAYDHGEHFRYACGDVLFRQAHFGSYSSNFVLTNCLNDLVRVDGDIRPATYPSGDEFAQALLLELLDQSIDPACLRDQARDFLVQGCFIE